MNIRKRLMDRTLDGLPPLQFGDVRTTTRANLGKIEPEVRELYPHLEAEGAQNASGHEERGRYKGKGGKYGNDSRGRQARSYGK